VDRLASALIDFGMKKGDSVASILPTCPEFIIINYACMKTGLIHVPLSIYHKSDDLFKKVQESRSKIIFCSYKELNQLESVGNCSSIKIVIRITNQNGISNDYTEISKINNLNFFKFEEIIAKYSPHKNIVDINPKEDIALLPFTGGTTGTPKGSMLTHFNITTNVFQTIDWILEPFKNDVVGKRSTVICVPIFHMYGLWAVHASIYWGLTIHLINPKNIDEIVRIINQVKPFIVFAVPTQYNSFCQMHLKKEKIFYISGTAPLTLDLIKKFETLTGVPMGDGYGATELSGAATFNISAFSRIIDNSNPLKIGVGIPLPDTQILIKDLATGMEVPLGKPGEMWVKGPQVMRGYYPSSGSGLEEDGWLKTADIVVMDKDGYIRVIDRIKDMINVSGNKVYCHKLEEILQTHPLIELVGVIGMPDTQRPGGEKIKAFIQLKQDHKGTLTKSDIKNFLQDKVPYYAVPKIVEFRENLPLTAVNKLDKKSLKD
jgi:long-chain acyl-CoA synthetase